VVFETVPLAMVGSCWRLLAFRGGGARTRKDPWLRGDGPGRRTRRRLVIRSGSGAG
jgi:hypothetical protein